MKRKAAFTALILIIAFVFCCVSFAGNKPSAELKVLGITPGDGAKWVQPLDMAVKIRLSESVQLEYNDPVNTCSIFITDPDGNEQPFKILHHQDFPDELWCVLKGDLVSDTEYTVTVKAGLKADSGNMLQKDFTSSFRTWNTKLDHIITICVAAAAAVAFAVFLIVDRIRKKKRTEKSAKESTTSSPKKKAETDPYKLAKKKGISVEKARSRIEKDKAKADKKNAARAKAEAKKKAKREAEIQKRLKKIHDASVYKVKTKGSVLAHGGTLPKALRKKQKQKKKQKKKQKQKKKK